MLTKDGLREKFEESQELAGPWLTERSQRHGPRALDSGAVRRLEGPARNVRGTWAGVTSKSSKRPDAVDYK